MSALMVRIGDLQWSRVFLYGLLASGLYWFALYNDGAALESQKQSVRQKMTEAQGQLEATKNAMRDANRFEQEVINLQQRFTRITEFMPETLRVSDLTTMIYDQAQRSGVRISGTDPQSGSEKIHFYEMMRIGITLDGSYSQIVTFLSNLSKAPRLVTFDNAHLQLSTSTAPGEVPKVRFQGTLVGYKYSRPTPSAPKAP